MKVLLIKDVKGLGKIGEVKEVKDGYGKNFLIGKGHARQATAEILKQWEEGVLIRAKNEAKEVKLVNDIKEIIESSKFTIKHRVGPSGHLIGTVTNKEIALELNKFNIVIDKKQIHLDTKIKTIGIYEVDCKLGHGVHAIIKIDVIEEI
ncbi:LSU ribosomal protein L9p [hydrothermal vent metagenome]|uniref:LSU ribosomal protein L9p n=1 Tax=hydrothermal vent metagenome TaxID=652676 RepID=A0A3B1E5S3_9ZZZZ